MCGRFTVTASLDELVMRFMLDRRPGKYQPRYNVAPGQWIPAIIGGERGSDPAVSSLNRMGELRWGLVPSWASDDSSGVRLLNARAESVAEKPVFRTLLERKRCLVPADGFYEWKAVGRKKQPYRFVDRTGRLFGMAALYDTWASSDGSKLHTCTIITTEANRLVAEVHHRMPVILPQEAEQIWLDRRIHTASILLPLLRPYPPEKLHSYEVDTRVGSVHWDDPACIEPYQTLI